MMMMKPALSRKAFQVAMASAVLLLAGCAATREPKPYSAEEGRARIAADQARMYADQEPVSGPIDFYEAAARALKYNLDYRLKLMESALASDLRDVSAHELLPRLMATAGRSGRNNDSGGTSIGIEDRQESLRASTSEERYHSTGGLGLSWSLLDFGVSYYRHQQKLDQVLMAEERRRKVAQNVIQDVRHAYWRALAAQRLLPHVDALLARTRQALSAAREAETRGLLPRAQVLAYQRALIDSVALLTVQRQDMDLARAELRALMSLPMSAQMVLADRDEPTLPQPVLDVAPLEQMAIESRPEIMEEWYRQRVNANDLKIAKAQLWPNVNFNLGLQYDSNKYLYNNSWIENSFQISMNILKMLQLPALESAEQSQTRVDDTRRIALSMAVLTQVRVGAVRYNLARSEVEFANESLRVDKSLLDQARAQSSTALGSELEVIRAEGRHLLSRYQREAAYSRAQAAWGRLYNSVGLAALPEQVAQQDVKTLATAIAATTAEQEAKGRLAGRAQQPQPQQQQGPSE